MGKIKIEALAGAHNGVDACLRIAGFAAPPLLRPDLDIDDADARSPSQRRGRAGAIHNRK